LSRFLKTFDPRWGDDTLNRSLCGSDEQKERPSVKKTTKITIETETLVIVRRAKVTRGWCPDCRAEVDVIALESNTLVESSITGRIQERLGTGKVHSWQPANGPVQICFPSLLGCFESAEARRVRRQIETQLDDIRRRK
jgi:hypothetical protein